MVRGWHFGRRPAVTSPRAREVLTEMTPALLAALGRTGDGDAGMRALDELFGRTTAAVELLSLLKSNPALLELFASMLGSAPRLAEIVARRPHALDHLIDRISRAACRRGSARAAFLRRSPARKASTLFWMCCARL